MKFFFKKKKKTKEEKINNKNNINLFVISETAKHFGVEVNAEEIAAAKAKGNANDDWKLTLALIKSKRNDSQIPTLQQVTEKFEGLFLIFIFIFIFIYLFIYLYFFFF